MLGLVSYFTMLAALAVATWAWPPVGCAAVLCLYGLKQWGQSTTAFVAEHSQFTNFAVFAIAVAGLLRASARRSCLICQWPPAANMILALLLYALASVIWSPNIEQSFEQWIIQGPYIVTVTLLAPLLIDDVTGARRALLWTAGVGAVICALALAFGHWGFRGLLLYGDLHEWETNPLALSSLAGTVFIISSLSLGRPNPVLLRALALACIPVALAVILRSGSRGQLIASGAAVVLTLPMAFRIRDTRSIAGLLIVAVLIVALGSWGASLVDIDSSRWESSESHGAVEGRLENALILLNAAAGHFGTLVFGLGNSSAFDILGIYPHIAGLEVLAEEGLVGAALYFAILVSSVRCIVRIAGQSRMSDARRHATAVLAALFIFELILSWKQGSLLSSVYAFMYTILLARLTKPEGLPAAGASGSDRQDSLAEARYPMLLR